MDLRKVAIFILGAESSGNTMILRSLAYSGFFNVTETRRIADVELPPNGEPIVWLRSCPHAREWPDVKHMKELVAKHGYDVRALVPVRDWWATSHSQVEHGHVSDQEEAIDHLRHSTQIYGQLATAGIPFVQLSYEAVTLDFQATLEHALLMLGIPCAVSVVDEIEYRNGKYL